MVWSRVGGFTERSMSSVLSYLAFVRSEFFHRLGARSHRKVRMPAVVSIHVLQLERIPQLEWIIAKNDPHPSHRSNAHFRCAAEGVRANFFGSGGALWRWCGGGRAVKV